ncbi:AI-2E family transporter [Pseudidiomarina terrestris]|uniref:AI-2E family transporter n=1 Tax=Pseudidiomarina terrestris TaxID=2820060 RepID=A0AAW7R0L8_9GAMM|nr:MULTISPECIES: AI-2E family transporter [unclassified Pseudidiomarina]MDN7124099.1 AI-2E family transporter [Pseudidiomarina sp. 1APP75-32.1]MDN7127171.1 AI-2E family transporter [Pseudidiomarina sp. 1APR75-33.1]MDN7128356.1 AI-2E family transporter [Pseudidiomarina sp. 1APR75-15]MDN7135416.1 AI-2E family transporter [Pseudidiomarina sp. 1ASP75-5]MDN7138552.1 AI-2E family transporter [Pseudidiomarina sp. 1ASP75-14]
MWDYLKAWYQRKFSDPDAITLFLLIAALFLLILFFGNLLAPILVAVALAYLLDWPVQRLQNMGFGHTLAAVIVFTLFIALNVLLILFLVPVIWQQSVALVSELPEMFSEVRKLLNQLPELFPGYISETNIHQMMDTINQRAIAFGETLISQSLSRLIGIMALLIYLIVVPLLVFFMLKDKRELLGHLSRSLPANRRLISQVSDEMNLQIMNYIRGKAIEVVIVGGITYIGFALFDLRYAALLAVLVGFSVLIPYIGAAVVTLPVALVGLFQFGWSAMFAYVMITYLIIQALDGNLLVPLLFSEAVSLNPVYIIAAVLIFGGLWGFWGVFFAIPLASLVKAVITALSTPTPVSPAAEDPPAPLSKN